MSISQHSGSTWQQGKDLYVKHQGVWKNVVEGHVNNASLWQRFHVSEEIITLNADASAVDVTSLFDSGEWTGVKTKRLIIPDGITLSGTSTAPALKISTAWNNLLTIENHGIIQGAGGVANGGIGGDAFENSIANSITLENYGTIRSGGGGGGQGGVGGGGSYGSTLTLGPYYVPNSYQIGGGGASSYWNNAPLNYSAFTYIKGSLKATWDPSSSYTYTYTYTAYQISRRQSITVYTDGGVGGAAGRGEGITGTAVSGASGASGGTNAGTGGTGGTGGSWGLAGAAGSTGTNGNNGSGASGSPGGLAGFAYKGQFSVINSGTILGRI